MVIDYDIHDIVPYINWIYFFHAWGMNGKPEAEKAKLRADAEAMLQRFEGRYHTHAVFEILPACSDGDDLLLGGKRIPMLRQQKVVADGQPNLCLADFVRPQTKTALCNEKEAAGKQINLNDIQSQETKIPSRDIADFAGVFATSVDEALTEENSHDDYERMLSQVVADRLAEGTAERMHEDVRRRYWGYAPDENLTMEQTHSEQYQGIRPAIGYPSLPDTSVNFLLAQLIDFHSIGIRLTESGMMVPHASVSGFMFAHPAARYFDLGKIGEDQLRDYAHRRGLPVELMRKFIMRR